MYRGIENQPGMTSKGPAISIESDYITAVETIWPVCHGIDSLHSQ